MKLYENFHPSVLNGSNLVWMVRAMALALGATVVFAQSVAAEQVIYNFWGWE